MCASPSLSLSEVLTAVWFLFGPAAVSRTRDGASSVDVRGAWPVFVFCVFSVLHVKVFSLRVLHSSSLHANIARPPSLGQNQGE